MKIQIYTLEKINEDEIRRIEYVLGLNEGTIDTSDVHERVSDNRDYFTQIGYHDHGQSRT